MASIEIPQGKVCYNSQYKLNCSTEETMETCTWMIAYPNQYPQIIGVGSEVELLPCSNQSSINLLNIKGNWAGECLNPCHFYQRTYNENETLKQSIVVYNNFSCF